MTEFGFAGGCKTERVDILSFGRVDCTCRPGQDGKANCEHTALVKTWKRQGRPGNARTEVPRVYGVEDGRLYYWRNGAIVPLSTVAQVNQNKGADEQLVRRSVTKERMNREFKGIAGGVE